MSDSSRFLDEIIATGQRLERRGMIAGTDGNISMRLADGRILVTCSGCAKGRLTREDLVAVDAGGHAATGQRRPSSELAMHLFVYGRRPDINACVHSHAPHATAFAVAGQSLPENVLPEVVLSVGAVPMTDYAPPGTEAVPRALEPFIDDNDAFLLRNHGLLTLGRDLEEAYNRHETVEHYARIVAAARQLGRVDAIPPDDVRRLEAMRRQDRDSREGRV
jgi:L-fuculose-phosphate aldolase